MARALRIELTGGRFHVTSRGNRQMRIHRSGSDRVRFFDWSPEATERFSLRVHANPHEPTHL